MRPLCAEWGRRCKCYLCRPPSLLSNADGCVQDEGEDNPSQHGSHTYTTTEDERPHLQIETSCFCIEIP